MLHLPILRHGVPYRSLDVVRVPHHRTREPFVEISQANAGLIRRDLLAERRRRRASSARGIPVRALLDDVRRRRPRPFSRRHAAARRRRARRRDDYVQQLSATTGMPHVLVRRNMRKIAGVLTRDARPCCAGLTRGLDLSILDSGHRRARRARPQLLPAHAVARHRAAEQLARRALAVGAGHRR